MTMACDYSGGSITSTATLHTATRAPEGHWTVTWLPGRVLDYNAAITAMTIAETDAVGHRDRATELVLAGLAAELDLTWPQAADLLGQNIPDPERYGPQTAQLLAAAARWEQLPHGSSAARRYGAAIEDDDAAIDAAEQHAALALTAAGINAAAVSDLGGCAWVHVALALAARHLIGQTPGWTQDAYTTLTRAWALALGPAHPDDTPQED